MLIASYPTTHMEETHYDRLTCLHTEWLVVLLDLDSKASVVNKEDALS